MNNKDENQLIEDLEAHNEHWAIMILTVARYGDIVDYKKIWSALEDFKSPKTDKKTKNMAREAAEKITRDVRIANAKYPAELMELTRIELKWDDEMHKYFNELGAWDR